MKESLPYPYNVLRPREYLTEQEVEHLMQTAKRRGRHGHRDATLILLAYRHGLRVGELCALRWDQVELDPGFLQVRRLKQGIPSVHPLRRPEIRALRQLRRETGPCAYLFATERGGPITQAGVRKMRSRCGERSDRAFPIHPHRLRHACGYKLANDAQDTRAIQHDLGHKNIQHTVRYMELSSERFKDFWDD